MRIDRRTRVLVIVVLLAALAAGCTAKRMAPLSVDPLDDLPSVQRRDGLVIAVEPLLDDRASRRRHGTSFLSEGVLAVRIAARNDGDDASWILQRSNVSLRIGETAAAASGVEGGSALGGAMQAGSLAVAAGSLAVVGALGLGLSVAALPLFYAGSKLDADASAVHQHLLLAELHPTTLSPGESATGLVYIPIERAPAPGEPWTVSVEVVRLPGDETERISFAVRLPSAFPKRRR
jgi:hypothetical protein